MPRRSCVLVMSYIGLLKLELDHTVVYRLSGGEKQTRVANLAPLGLRAHRAKTAGIWKVQQPLPGGATGSPREVPVSDQPRRPHSNSRIEAYPHRRACVRSFSAAIMPPRSAQADELREGLHAAERDGARRACETIRGEDEAHFVGSLAQPVDGPDIDPSIAELLADALACGIVRIRLGAAFVGTQRVEGEGTDQLTHRRADTGAVMTAPEPRAGSRDASDGEVVGHEILAPDDLAALADHEEQSPGFGAGGSPAGEVVLDSVAAQVSRLAQSPVGVERIGSPLGDDAFRCEVQQLWHVGGRQAAQFEIATRDGYPKGRIDLCPGSHPGRLYPGRVDAMWPWVAITQVERANYTHVNVCVCL